MSWKAEKMKGKMNEEIFYNGRDMGGWGVKAVL